MKNINDILKFLNSIFKDSIIEFVDTKDKFIIAKIKDDKYIERITINSFTGNFTNKVENSLFAMGAETIKYRSDKLCCFKCYDKNNNLLWK